MFFKSLETLRGNVTSFGVAVSFTGDDKLTVVVTPKISDGLAAKAPHLATPFVLTGTADELDEGFVGQFNIAETARKTLQEQTMEQIAKAKAAAEVAKPPLSALSKAGSTSGKNSAGAAALTDLLAKGQDVDDEDIGTEGTPEDPKPVTQEPAGGPVAVADLFA